MVFFGLLLAGQQRYVLRATAGELDFFFAVAGIAVLQHRGLGHRHKQGVIARRIGAHAPATDFVDDSRAHQRLAVLIKDAAPHAAQAQRGRGTRTRAALARRQQLGG